MSSIFNEIFRYLTDLYSIIMYEGPGFSYFCCTLELWERGHLGTPTPDIGLQQKETNVDGIQETSITGIRGHDKKQIAV